jgi:hypothetical protein
LGVWDAYRVTLVIAKNSFRALGIDRDPQISLGSLNAGTRARKETGMPRYNRRTNLGEGRRKRSQKAYDAKRTGHSLSLQMETLCSDAIQRIAEMIGVAVQLDDPEPALVSAVEKRIAELMQSVSEREPQPKPAGRTKRAP